LPGQINYLRLSITDRCNLRCFYCTPWVDRQKLPSREILRYEELLHLAGVAAGVGIRKLRVTGGEPLVRRGLWNLSAACTRFPGSRKSASPPTACAWRKWLRTSWPPACATSTSAWTPCAGIVTRNSPAPTTSVTSWPASIGPRPWVLTPSRSTAWS